MDKSWLFLFPLFSWSFTQFLINLSPHEFKLSHLWGYSILATCGILFSVMIHESGHMLVSVLKAGEWPKRTIYLFGSTGQNPYNPYDLLTVLSGPLFNFLFALFLSLFFLVPSVQITNSALSTIITCIIYFNFFLAVINLIPIPPMDLSHLLHNYLKKKRGNVELLFWAGTITSLVLFTSGIALLLKGRFIFGLWTLIIAILQNSSLYNSYQTKKLQDFFRGEKVQKYMRRNPIIVPGSVSLSFFKKEYLSKYHFETFPVNVAGSLLKQVDISSFNSIPEMLWEEKKISEIAVNCDDCNSLSINSDVVDALVLMKNLQKGCVVVTDNFGNLAGVLSCKDLIPYISTKIDLSPQ
ncbi:hypothetical protein QA601_09365 [Chitinispirillales bacterium ANBcel5]|uniref:CBS domain-containing protein n=1 Tax=Cellulosispirillum alkaliphilum TaxID=3039283 RepID=UPI002A55ED15|nr:hypothetical protein [Chitinispirillales bacterium ANBcel5]